MYFEIYVDSLFCLQFVMNLYILGLVNNMLHQTISLKRVVFGALLGAICSLVPFLLPMKMVLCVLCSFLLSLPCMSLLTFRTYRKEAFLKVLEKLVISTLLLGGMFLMLVRILPKKSDTCLGITGVLLLGGGVYCIVKKLLKGGRKENNICKVTLFGDEVCTVEALLDTGNSLVEPISGKPVAVLEKSIFEKLFKETKPTLFRAIPYHSIGKKSGILQGYLLGHILVETEETSKEYKEIYVGVSEEIISQTNTYKMILNPRILE